jgi:hypothetical protein
MSKSDVLTETREVSDFDRVSLREFGELVITQGEEESLTIEARRNILSRIKTEVKASQLIIGSSGSWLDQLGDALASSFRGERIRCNLTVKQLRGLEVSGAGAVRVGKIETDRLALQLRGAGDVNIESLDAEGLTVDLPGAGRISVAGRVAEQTVTISGAGSYDAPKLESQKAKVTLTGLGSATVWAVEGLDATIRGLGGVSYYGTPEVRKEITGAGGVKSLGNP